MAQQKWQCVNSLGPEATEAVFSFFHFFHFSGLFVFANGRCGGVSTSRLHCPFPFESAKNKKLLPMRRAVKCAELCVLLACAAADKDKSKKDKNAVVAGAGAGGSGGLLIDDELAREEDVEFITFEGRSDGKLYANGQPFALKGINWFGSEGRIGAPGTTALARQLVRLGASGDMRRLALVRVGSGGPVLVAQHTGRLALTLNLTRQVGARGPARWPRCAFYRVVLQLHQAAGLQRGACCPP